MMRPARSDAHLPPEEAAKIEQETRQYFDQIAPKRHAKPSRSDYSDSDSDADGHYRHLEQDPIPELQRLRDLAANPQQQKLVISEGRGSGEEVVEEYVETEYYKDLNCIDKQHHTTGTGFIKVEQTAEEKRFEVLHPVSVSVSPASAYKGNPATNEWVPCADPVIPISNKPSRSDI